jgi:hypothetical protein
VGQPAPARHARFELTLGAREQAALVPLNESAKHVGADGDMASYKRLVKESGVLWAALVADLRAITLAPDSPRAPRQAALLRYLEARERFCRLALLAADGDPEAIRDVPKTVDDANAALEQLKTL